MISLIGQTYITNLEKTVSRSVRIFYRIRHHLNESALKSCILASSAVICSMQLELGVESVRQALDQWFSTWRSYFF